MKYSPQLMRLIIIHPGKRVPLGKLAEEKSHSTSKYLKLDFSSSQVDDHIMAAIFLSNLAGLMPSD